MIRLKTFVVASVVLTAVVACGDSDLMGPMLMEPTLNEDLAQLEMMEAEILEFIGEPTCSDVPECAAIAFGSKPCGGPWTYLLYSTPTVDAAELRDMVDEYNAFNDVVNERHRIWSDCAIVITPTLQCVEGLCVDTHTSP